MARKDAPSPSPSNVLMQLMFVIGSGVGRPANQQQ